MTPLKNFVVALLLTAWTGPTVAHAARPSMGGGVPAVPVESSRAPATTALSPSALLALGSSEGQSTAAIDEQEADALAAREQAAPTLQDYRGGHAYIYIGSGATLILVLILLIILL